ncbi:WD repeat protein [Ceratobasidium sp. AG-Ba]|nr:WD repeat protein [Ceratobasidium sp. AG-Ba]
MKRHPKSSLIARFQPNLPALTPTVADTSAISVYEARCEAQSNRIFEPIKLRVSKSNICLALIGATGYKSRAPGLSYYLLNETEPSTDFHKERFLKPGLGDVARHMIIEEGRRLIFVGDDSRVKSYAWTSTGGGIYEREPHPTHMLQSRNYKGPMTVLPNGTVIRAGHDKAAVWNIDELRTHGENGRKTIGRKDKNIIECSDRGSDDEIEISTGTSPKSEIALAKNLNLSAARWEPLVQSPSMMICYPDSYECFSLDLEHGGKISNRYLGHGGKVTDVSVSQAEPQMFLTACTDGFVRLFDLRAPLPVVTFDACGQGEFCYAAVLVHPDGIPTVFNGTGKSEQIKMWDVRARTPVYELATGNNRVGSLAWDSERNCLYAATECSYQDGMGYRYGYRYSRKFKTQKVRKDDFEPDIAWPTEAYHDEGYFGYAFDAGEHRIYRYAFKENPDTSRMPEYGDADVGEDDSRW